MEEKTTVLNGVDYLKQELKKELEPLFLQKFLEAFNVESLSSEYIVLMALYFVKKYIENPEEVIESLGKNREYYLEEASEMQVLYYLEEAVKEFEGSVEHGRRNFNF